MRMVAALAFVALVGAGSAQAQSAKIEVWKTPWCGCCAGWVEAMRTAGFDVETTDLEDLAMVRELAGVPPELASCHTAMVDGYAIDGHVPAAAIARLLEERPAVSGLSAPGMPLGSPGMAGPPEPYEVWSFGADGAAPWATYSGARRLD